MSRKPLTDEQREKKRATDRAYYQSHKDQAKSRAKAWANKNPDKRRKIKKGWNKRNPDYFNDHYQNNKDMRRFITRKYMYGITAEEFNAMRTKQKDRCAICGVEFDDTRSHRINVDHCHTTGRVRGLLCTLCNTMIGMAKDDVAKLTNAIDYLQKDE